MDLEQIAGDALNLARVYPEHAAQYRRAVDSRDMANACRRYIRGTELGTELDNGDRDPQAQRDYDWQTERCGRDWQTLTYLRVAVAGLLPGLHLRLIPMGGKPWHERDGFDWPAACQELQQIVYAAVTANSQAKPGEPPEEAPKRLTDSQQAAYNLIRDEGPLQGNQIVNRLGIGSESSFTRHYVPALKLHGVKNRRGLGYYLDPPT